MLLYPLFYFEFDDFFKYNPFSHKNELKYDFELNERMVKTVKKYDRENVRIFDTLKTVQLEDKDMSVGFSSVGENSPFINIINEEKNNGYKDNQIRHTIDEHDKKTINLRDAEDQFWIRLIKKNS